MSVLAIRKHGDSILRQKCKPLKEVNDSVRELIANMAKTMYQNNGVGLAAPQVGVDKRVVIVDPGNGLIALINPTILSKEGKIISQEGCLSIQGIQVDIERAKRITVEGLDPEGKHVKLVLDGLAARAMQQEIDHLNGTLIIDHLSFVKRQIIKKHLSKL